MIENKCNIETDLDAGYLSYPAIPYWNNIDSKNAQNKWIFNVNKTINKISQAEGISIYIHLPFCEKLCSFCSYSPFITKHHHTEQQYLKYLIKEWYLYLKLFPIKPYVKQLYVGGGTPTFFSAENLKLLFTKILSTIKVDDKSILEFEGHPNNTTTDHLIELYKLGFSTINVGIQDFNPMVQQTINRFQSFENIDKLTKTARHIGYKSIGYDLIYGLPFQSRKTIINNIYKLRELNPNRIRLIEYKHLPQKNPAQKKYEQYLPIELEKNTLLAISKKMIEESGYYNIGMNNYVKQNDPLYVAKTNNSLHRNLMGYTNHRTRLTIGLGASAISDSWHATVQNERSLNAYYNSIDNNIVPVAKAYFLNKEDHILRRHILNLQCKFETKWNNKELDSEFFRKGLYRLKDLENLNLITVSKNSIKIKKKGLNFLRNICSVLDTRVTHFQDSINEKPMREVYYGVTI